ncbi:hypothetical protein C4559_04655 [Candidatus Microgenomates bacterium]|nr:MAG: hypothetical protein C4559_04655 [Candidatus Microgenomates bacterium]
MGKLFLFTIFFVITPVFIVFNIIFLLYFIEPKHQVSFSIPKTPNSNLIYAALPTTQNDFSAQISLVDVRIGKVKDFFARYNSPLEPYAQHVINTADQNNIDYRLIPAIAMQESNLCRRIPKDSYNCWGFGIYADKIKRFDNYQQAIEIVTKTLAKYYKSQGLETPEQIMSKYTPGSNGSWARGVTQFMDQLQ